jgi:hypothetical protein
LASEGDLFALYAEHDGQWYTSGDKVPTGTPDRLKLVWNHTDDPPQIEPHVHHRGLFDEPRTVPVPAHVSKRLEESTVGAATWEPDEPPFAATGQLWLEATITGETTKADERSV